MGDRRACGFVASYQGFIAKAPEAVIEENRRRLAEEEARKTGLEAALMRVNEE